MLAAEQSGTFQYKDGASSISEMQSTEATIDRLQDLSISAKDSFLSKIITSTVQSAIPEKATTKPASNFRPLTLDDDDLDDDLGIDDNIDTTVSLFILIFLYRNILFTRLL